MSESIDVKVFFNFRSPYCYLASKTLFQIFDDYYANLIWRPLGGWGGRSPPERAKVKIPLVRQDMRRITQKMGIPMTEAIQKLYKNVPLTEANFFGIVINQFFVHTCNLLYRS